MVNGGVAQLAAPMRLVAVKDGKEIEVPPGEAKAGRHVEAEADFTGSAEAAGLRFAARTHVEFDGFVNVNLDVAPAGNEPAKVDRLFLEIALPAEEATHFCTTAGGWSAVHDALPDHWSSRTHVVRDARGRFRALYLADQLRPGLLWFADHDKGWNHEPDKAPPTQEIVRKDGKVYLRVNFFAVPTEVKAPRTITWGWQTFPSRPLPPGWRATFCASAAADAAHAELLFLVRRRLGRALALLLQSVSLAPGQVQGAPGPGGQGPASSALRRLDRPLDRTLPGLRRAPVSGACRWTGARRRARSATPTSRPRKAPTTSACGTTSAGSARPASADFTWTRTTSAWKTTSSPATPTGGPTACCSGPTTTSASATTSSG